MSEYVFYDSIKNEIEIIGGLSGICRAISTQYDQDTANMLGTIWPYVFLGIL